MSSRCFLVFLALAVFGCTICSSRSALKCASLEELGCDITLRCIEGNKKDSQGCLMCECASGIEEPEPEPNGGPEESVPTAEPRNGPVERNNPNGCPAHDCDRLNCPHGLEVVAGFKICASRSVECPLNDDCSYLNCPHGIGFYKDADGCVLCNCKECPVISCPKFTCYYGRNETIDEDGCVNSCKCNKAPDACPLLDCRALRCPKGLDNALEANGCVNSCKCKQDLLDVLKLIVAKTCSLPLDVGKCRGTIYRWYHNSTENRCKMFVYSGCEGNLNNFLSEINCNSFCKAETKL